MNKYTLLMLAGGLAVALGVVLKFMDDSTGESRIYVPGSDTAFLKSSDLSWKQIPQHYTPSTGIDDWQKLQPARHWKPGNSAYETASAWETANPGLPPEIRALFGGSAKLLAAIPEHKTPLPGGTPSKMDVLAFIRTRGKVCAVAVEGKADEGFGMTVEKWRQGASAGKIARLKHISEKLGLPYPPPDHIRYQLLHRAASAVIEAERFNADCAAMVIHSFAQEQKSFKGFGSFLNLFGIRSVGNEELYATNKTDVPLSFGWVFSPKGSVASTATTARKLPIDTIVILTGILLLIIGFGAAKRSSNTQNKKEIDVSTEDVHVGNLINSVQEIQDKLDKVLEKDIENNVDINKLNGDKFEKFVVTKFNIKGKRFHLKEWAGDKYVDGIYPETTKEPDLKLTLNAAEEKWHFAVECKWRNRFHQDSVTFAKRAQLTNYQKYEERTKEKTFIVLGVGGTADNPENVYIIPVSELAEAKLTREQLQPYYQRNKGFFYYDYKKRALSLRSGRGSLTG